MRRRFLRAAAIGGATTILTAGLIGISSPAGAAPPSKFATSDQVLPVGGTWIAHVYDTTAYAKGDVVFAFATKPLTGQAGDGAGLPAGFTPIYDGCKPVPGYTAVLTCPVDGRATGPAFTTAGTTADMTAAYFGYAYVPTGGDLAAGIRTAQSAGSLPAGDTYGTAKATFLTPAHAAQNTVAFDTPDLPSGGSVRHTLRLHVVDPGELTTYFRTAQGQPRWRRADIRIDNVKTSAGAACTVHWSKIVDGTTNLNCDLTPGEQTIEYTLTAPAGLETWRLESHTMYDIYTGGYDGVTLDPKVYSHAGFTLKGGPLNLRHRLVARDGSGRLFEYLGTGNVPKPFYSRSQIATGWQTYNALTKLSPVTEDLQFGAAKPPAATLQGRGDLVARDSAGNLWYYKRQFDGNGPFAARTKAGTGWNIYTTFTGGGDLNRDGKADLVARDKSGVLWLYKGTGSATAPFAARTRIGTGWNTYSQLAGSADLTGDGKADLVARDKSGVLWLYKGTGSATAPFAARTRIGTGWNTYKQISVVGDLNSDGKADLVGSDSTGGLWFYKGTGKATAPFAARTRIGSSGWNTYNRIL
ncbi:FG-GAP repeat domain-containing protein [Streptomyces sp. NPDC059718]